MFLTGRHAASSWHGYWRGVISEGMASATVDRTVAIRILGCMLGRIVIIDGEWIDICEMNCSVALCGRCLQCMHLNLLIDPFIWRECFALYRQEFGADKLSNI